MSKNCGGECARGERRDVPMQGGNKVNSAPSGESTPSRPESLTIEAPSRETELGGSSTGENRL